MNVWFPRPAQAEQKLAHLKSAGSQNIEILSDWDETMTSRYFSNGVQCPVSHSPLRDNQAIKVYSQYYGNSERIKNYIEQDNFLLNIYWTKICSHDLDQNTKIALCVEWMNKYSQLVAETRFDRQFIKRMLEIVPLTVREGFFEFLNLATRASIPIYIISGGFYDSICFTVMQHKLGQLLGSQIFVHANSFEYSEDGFAEGFSKPYLTPCNKAEWRMLRPHPQRPDSRRCAFLLGDIPEDLALAQGHSYEEVFSVGYCNKKECDLKHYDQFDAVITGDPGKQPAIKLFQRIL